MVAKYFVMAWQGRRIWLKLKKQYRIIDDVCLVIMPENDDEMNLCALNHIDNFLKKKHLQKAIVVTINKHNDLFKLQNSDKIDIVYISDRDIELLLKYYLLVMFKDNISVISLSAPYGSKGLLKKPGVTLDYLVELYILGE